MDYKGIIIEESLKNISVLKNVFIISTKIEQVTKEHQTSWLKQWTLHTVDIPENKAKYIANEISKCLETKHNWYADFKNDKFHFIIFTNKVFKVNRQKETEYNKVKKYGLSLGIPDYQLDFSPQVKV